MCVCVCFCRKLLYFKRTHTADTLQSDDSVRQYSSTGRIAHDVYASLLRVNVYIRVPHHRSTGVSRAVLSKQPLTGQLNTSTHNTHIFTNVNITVIEMCTVIVNSVCTGYVDMCLYS